jgi:hypothetical protein
MPLRVGWLRKSIAKHEARCTLIADTKAETLRAQFLSYSETEDE